MSAEQVLQRAKKVIWELTGHTLNVLEVTKPPDFLYALHLAKVISKLSPIVANMLEFAIVSILNEQVWDDGGQWIRQDPGFPDTLFVGNIETVTGIEVKTWFPLATEITARFKDSIRLLDDNVEVALLTWLPEYILYGKPRVIGVWITTAKSLAITRDSHYHNPPDYLVVEPEDTTDRTKNLQQTNVAGYKFQGTAEELVEATKTVRGWGKDGHKYSSSPSYQRMIRALMSTYRYRLDTNFAKLDRIEHAGLEQFKSEVLNQKIFGHTIATWSDLVKTEEGVQTLLNIQPQSTDVIS